MDVLFVQRGRHPSEPPESLKFSMMSAAFALRMRSACSLVLKSISYACFLGEQSLSKAALSR